MERLSRSSLAGLASIALALLAFASLGSCDDDGPTGPTAPLPFELGQYGSFVDATEYVNRPQTLPPFAMSSTGEPAPLPARAVHGNLPAVAMQGTPAHLGSPGTCEAQAFGYGLGSFTAARLPDGTIKWNPADPSNTASAAFLFALAMADGFASCPRGGLALNYLDQLIMVGAPSSAQVPYVPSCRHLKRINTGATFPDEARFRIGSFSTFAISPDQLVFMKRLVAAGHAIAFSGPVFENYDDPEIVFGVFGTNKGPQPPLIPNSGHGQLIVGFDDNKGDPAAPGAFLIQNSFGTAWPPQDSTLEGRIWWAYETFTSSQTLAAVAYSRAEAVPNSGELQSTLQGPRGFVTGVHQWVDPNDTKHVLLIVELQFTEPVLLDTVSVTEPTTGTTVNQAYALPFSTGYIFFERVDGAQFTNGSWPITLNVVVSGTGGTYTGSIDVDQSVPTAPPADTVAPPVFGTIGTEATVTTG